MSKKKKLILAYIIIIVLILIFGAISIFLFLKDNEKSLSNIDMSLLNENLANESNFRSERTSDVTLENIEEIFNIKKDIVKEVIGKVPLFNISSGMYVIIHANDEKVDEVFQKIIEYGNLYENEWSTYMEDQYELVKNRKIGKEGEYVYMIVSENAEDMLDYLCK